MMGKTPRCVGARTRKARDLADSFVTYFTKACILCFDIGTLKYVIQVTISLEVDLVWGLDTSLR